MLRKALIGAFDIALCAIASWFAFWLRLGEWQFLTVPALIFLGISVVAWMVSATVTRVYRSVVRYLGRHTVISLAYSCGAMSVLLCVILLSARFDGVPRTLAIIQPIILFLLLSAQRAAIARLLSHVSHGPRRLVASKRVLILGAGPTGQQLAASVRQDNAIDVVAFIDSNKSLRKRLVDGKLVWHTTDLERVLASEDIDDVFLAIPKLKRANRRAVVERIRRADPRVRVRLLPSASQLASGTVSVNDLREVQIEELLGRDEVPPDPLLISKNITGRRVLVTGAGGSIGSELCRQIIRQNPSLLVMAEQSEHALYLIDTELRELKAREALTCELVPELINVAAEGQCERLFQRVLPQTVFHAAAYKHVPLVEANPVAGMRNNILGTLNATLAAESAGSDKFILVSTDKAVRPTNIMGATKRVCELIVQARADAQSHTRYSSVRFGNVLGSSGSVIPRFRKQIASGGPLTITHRDATRYFMTIPEAAQLVIQAGALADDGEVLLLDMGQPVKIIDLARAMIELSGLTIADETDADGDISIIETGLRPGEKLVEELLIDAASEGTAHPRIIKARENMISWGELAPIIERLRAYLFEGDSKSSVEVLRRLVPEYIQEAPATLVVLAAAISSPARLRSV